MKAERRPFFPGGRGRCPQTRDRGAHEHGVLIVVIITAYSIDHNESYLDVIYSFLETFRNSVNLSFWLI